MTRWSGELMVSLMPMNVEVKTQSTIQFTCNYDFPDDFHIYFKLSSLDELPITAWSEQPGPIMKTEKGAFRTWFVHVERTACNVECHIMKWHHDKESRELVKIVTSATPGLTNRHSERASSCPSIGDSWRGRTLSVVLSSR
ncbi:uncharacterized protein LOC112590723 [Harpegnathos saltator]|uniref:uncharacterized protein LOC112590723 n=1 Tax=Harpegnathos saltator TaxID=610380 RepID=UPI000DBED92F|nr:uncharacterized protein LOC112590723 [Harpegnathos saltator]